MKEYELSYLRFQVGFRAPRVGACHAGELVSTHGVPTWGCRGLRGGQIQPFLFVGVASASHCHIDNLTMLDSDSKNAGQGESFIFGFEHSFKHKDVEYN